MTFMGLKLSYMGLIMTYMGLKLSYMGPKLSYMGLNLQEEQYPLVHKCSVVLKQFHKHLWYG